MASFSNLRQMLAWIERREHTNQTTDIVAEGPRGAGKSNGTHYLMECLTPRFDFDSCYVYDAFDAARILRDTSGTKHGKIWFDEAKNIVYRRNAMTRINKSVSTVMSQIRERQGTRFWVSPDVSELEAFLTQDQAQILLTYPYPGHVIARRFWKNYSAPPGKREGRWTTAFRRDGIPWMRDVDPDREAEYLRHKSEGYRRVELGLVDRLVAAATKTNKTMSIVNVET